MNTRSITFRLAAWCAAVSLLVCAGFGVYTWTGLRYYLRRSQTDTLVRRAHQVAAIVAAHAGREGDAFTIDQIKTSYAPELNDRFIRVRRPDGSILYVSGAPGDKAFDPATVPALPLPDGRSDRPGALTLGNLLLVQTSAPTASGSDRYVIDCGASRLPGEHVLQGFLTVLGLGLAVDGGRRRGRRSCAGAPGAASRAGNHRRRPRDHQLQPRPPPARRPHRR